MSPLWDDVRQCDTQTCADLKDIGKKSVCQVEICSSSMNCPRIIFVPAFASGFWIFVNAEFLGGFQFDFGPCAEVAFQKALSPRLIDHNHSTRSGILICHRYVHQVSADER
ncbi:MAG: hypothetical protein BWY82_02562 [Verrucomicrobia bacterium ADurb.Bin474]|nr:MAG: hypothetical protein BWY82_02562 [Verrucomicrobia bacterium ADurb.Bin474]